MLSRNPVRFIFNNNPTRISLFHNRTSAANNRHHHNQKKFNNNNSNNNNNNNINSKSPNHHQQQQQQLRQNPRRGNFPFQPHQQLPPANEQRKQNSCSLSSSSSSPSAPLSLFPSDFLDERRLQLLIDGHRDTSCLVIRLPKPTNAEAASYLSKSSSSSTPAHWMILRKLKKLKRFEIRGNTSVPGLATASDYVELARSLTSPELEALSFKNTSSMLNDDVFHEFVMMTTRTSSPSIAGRPTSNIDNIKNSNGNAPTTISSLKSLELIAASGLTHRAVDIFTTGAPEIENLCMFSNPFLSPNPHHVLDESQEYNSNNNNNSISNNNKNRYPNSSSSSTKLPSICLSSSRSYTMDESLAFKIGSFLPKLKKLAYHSSAPLCRTLQPFSQGEKLESLMMHAPLLKLSEGVVPPNLISFDCIDLADRHEYEHMGSTMKNLRHLSIRGKFLDPMQNALFEEHEENGNITSKKMRNSKSYSSSLPSSSDSTSSSSSSSSAVYANFSKLQPLAESLTRLESLRLRHFEGDLKKLTPWFEKLGPSLRKIAISSSLSLKSEAVDLAAKTLPNLLSVSFVSFQPLNFSLDDSHLHAVATKLLKLEHLKLAGTGTFTDEGLTALGKLPKLSLIRVDGFLMKEMTIQRDEVVAAAARQQKMKKWTEKRLTIMKKKASNDNGVDEGDDDDDDDDVDDDDDDERNGDGDGDEGNVRD